MMDDLPVTTAQLDSSAASSASSQESSSHRSCSVCKKRISNIKYDRHTVCIMCRTVRCDNNQRCSECASWKDKEMASYIKHRKTLQSKGRKKEVIPPVTTTSATTHTFTPDLEPESVRLVEEKISQKVVNLLIHC